MSLILLTHIIFIIIFSYFNIYTSSITGADKLTSSKGHLATEKESPGDCRIHVTPREWSEHLNQDKHHKPHKDAYMGGGRCVQEVIAGHHPKGDPGQQDTGYQDFN